MWWPQSQLNPAAVAGAGGIDAQAVPGGECELDGGHAQIIMAWQTGPHLPTVYICRHPPGRMSSKTRGGRHAQRTRARPGTLTGVGVDVLGRVDPEEGVAAFRNCLGDVLLHRGQHLGNDLLIDLEWQ